MNLRRMMSQAGLRLFKRQNLHTSRPIIIHPSIDSRILSMIQVLFDVIPLAVITSATFEYIGIETLHTLR